MKVLLRAWKACKLLLSPAQFLITTSQNPIHHHSGGTITLAYLRATESRKKTHLLLTGPLSPPGSYPVSLRQGSPLKVSKHLVNVFPSSRGADPKLSQDPGPRGPSPGLPLQPGHLLRVPKPKQGEGPREQQHLLCPLQGERKGGPTKARTLLSHPRPRGHCPVKVPTFSLRGQEHGERG